MKLKGLSDTKQRFLASLPVLLYMLIVASPAILGLIADKPLRSNQISVNIILFLSVFLLLSQIIVCVIALFQKMPKWSMTWLGSTLFTVFFVFILIGDDKEFIIHPLADGIIFIVFGLVYFLFLFISVGKGWQYSSRYGLGISTVGSFAFCLLMMSGPFNQYLLALSAIPLGILTFFLIYHYTNRTKLQQLFIVITFGILNLTYALLLSFAYGTAISQPSTFVIIALGFILILYSLGPLISFCISEDHNIKKNEMKKSLPPENQ